jgi:cytoskeletal protein RodZ
MRLKRQLRRVRNSTWVLAVIFVAALAAYAMVKPAQANLRVHSTETVQPASSRTPSPQQSQAKLRSDPLAERTKSATLTPAPTPTPTPDRSVRPSPTATTSSATVPATSTPAATPTPSATGSAAQTSLTG